MLRAAVPCPSVAHPVGRGLMFQAWTFELPGFRRFLDTLRSGTFPERASTLATLAIVGLGVWLRCRSVTTAPLWLDEAYWANLLLEQPLKEHLIRPIGFMAIERALVGIFSPSEAVLRFLPWLGGMIVTFISVPLARRLFRSEASRLLFVSMIAMDPAAIDLAKEFKPYAVCLTVHATLVLLVLRYSDSGKGRDLFWVLTLSFLAVLFAQDAIFAYPAVFLLIAVDALRARRRRHLVATVIVGALTVAVIGALYVFIWSKMEKTTEESYWGKKYNVFYVSGGTKTDWVVRRYADMVETPALRRELWDTHHFSQRTVEELGALYGELFLFLHAVGIVVVLRGKRWREGVLFVLPLAVMLTFNLLGFWPLGPFRSNLFTLVHIAALAGFAIDREAKKARFGDLAPAALAIFLPLFVFERGWHRTKETLSVTTPSLFPDALRELIRLQGPRDPGQKESLVTDAWSCPMYRYYTKYHPVYSKTLAPELNRRFDLNCRTQIPKMLSTTRSALRDSQDRAWLIVSSAKFIDKLDNSWPHDLHQFASSRVGEGLHLILGVEKTQAQREPAP